MMTKEKSLSPVIGSLVGGILIVSALWLTFAPGTVTRAEMQDYVEVTATEHLRLLRGDLQKVQETLVQVRERLSGVEVALGRGD